MTCISRIREAIHGLELCQITKSEFKVIKKLIKNEFLLDEREWKHLVLVVRETDKECQ
jgi:hypothetical protein